MKFFNLTPHEIRLNNGSTFQPSGQVARVNATFEPHQAQHWCDCDYCVNGGGEGCLSQPPIIYEQKFGEIEGLPDPDPQAGTQYIVSAIVLAAAKAAGRNDCLAPATGHQECVRNENGHIVSVPGFVK